MGERTKHTRYTRDEIAAGKYDIKDLIMPLWANIVIYHSVPEYNSKIAKYSLAQRRITAVFWYWLTVNKAGHLGFFENEEGLLWKDALEGLEMIGAEKAADNLRDAASKFGGSLPLDTKKRRELISKLCAIPDEKFPVDIFCENDDIFQNTSNYRPFLNEYARSHPDEFVIDEDFDFYWW